ncbi:MAG TPA: hypothetical protein VFW95_11840 [Candidatus Limnocylindria bacterium]|nr:hypothetical protein [Candidatus Limnocylindria bacterium]
MDAHPELPLACLDPLSSVPMLTPIDEATSQFLEAAAEDLQRQLGIVGIVERVDVRPWPGGTNIVAVLRIGKLTADVQGLGDSLLTAYADLRRHLVEPALIASFRNLYDSVLPTER